MAAANLVRIRALACPNCGGTVELRGMGNSLSAVCGNCLTVLDTSSPEVKAVQTFQAAIRYQPAIALGTRGTWDGDPWEVIGFMVRSMKADGTRYSWREYVLFNPYKGFRYLTEYNGHWNSVKVIRSLPEPAGRRRNIERVRVLDGLYTHFQTYKARVDFVLGEFPWRVRVGDKAELTDYVNPPAMLSSEQTWGEIAWSLGTWVPGKTVWKNFHLPGSAPPATGVYANQPSPYQGRPRELWRLCLWSLIAVFVIWLGFRLFDRQEAVYNGHFSYSPRQKTEAAFVTPSFDLKGRTSSVEISTTTDLDNNWVYLNMALINETTGQTYDFGREVSYYHGRDSDGAWTEGRPEDAVMLSSIPPGRYFLRVEPEMDPGAPREVNYALSVRRDVPTFSYIWFVALLLVIPPIVTWFRSVSFENARWNESDHPRTSSSSGDDD